MPDQQGQETNSGYRGKENSQQSILMKKIGKC